ncbi:DEAD/DEAH box helicase [Actinophytocola sp.]|uniref:DEAD/DEAH box helicase n=1 Tax=Actinophytocola sp. TaxID=1872138 RepID=UPI00389A026A
MAIVSVGSFRGLFVGVNRYQSPLIAHLKSAVRDAQALHALFSDNLGGTAAVVADEDATRARLVDELTRLAADSTEDDVVVIGFSGHGSDTHELVTYDADPADLPSTGLPLSEFTDLVSVIPARQLVVVLDCCFSGGAGAKVLHATTMSRGGVGGVPLSTAAQLDRLAGTGRLILTAATADQPAWEDVRIGHGLLTHHLLQALLGATDVARQGELPLYALLAYVTRSVTASASSTAAARQEPTLRGQMDGEITWPVFQPGPLYTALFPSLARTPVSADLRSLRSHGISEPVLEAWTTSVPALNQLQQDTINEAGLLDGHNVLVTAPTSSGKTMIGELAALKATQNGGRSVFLLPTRALVNEQYTRFRRTYGPVGVRTIRVTGEISDQAPELLRGQFDLAVLTYEMFANLALGNPHLLRLLAVVVIDEVQSIVDRERGPGLELLLTLLKVRHDEGIAPQVVALSAVLGDLGGLDSWLEATVIRRTERPVPLLEGVLGPDGVYRHLTPDGNEATEQIMPAQPWAQRNRDVITPLVTRLVADGQQVIVFRNTRGKARGCANYLANALTLPAATDALDALPAGDPSVVSGQLRQCLQGGVAFHISDLDRDEKQVIEDHFRAPDSKIRVIVATTTLAQGVNLPAETVVIGELDHPAGRDATMPYTVAEYKNIAGRAGRLGLTSQGRAVVIVGGAIHAEQRWNRYITGTPEDLVSRLLDGGTDLLTVVLRVIAIAEGRTGQHGLSDQDVVTFLANSFAAHQRRITTQDELFNPSDITPALDELLASGLVESTTTGLHVTELGTMVAQSSLGVRSAVRVATVLRNLHSGELNRATLIGAAQLTAELDAIYLPFNARGWQPERTTSFNELRRHQISATMLTTVATAPERSTAIIRAKRAVCCLLWMGGVPLAQIEALLTRHVPARDAAGAIRQTVSRTRDVITTVLEIAQHLHPSADLTHLAGQLPVQLELGVPADLVPLAVHAGNELGRPDYLRLYHDNLRTPDAVLAADEQELLQCVGGKQNRLQTLLDAAEAAKNAGDVLDFADVLPAATD